MVWVHTTSGVSLLPDSTEAKAEGPYAWTGVECVDQGQGCIVKCQRGSVPDGPLLSLFSCCLFTRVWPSFLPSTHAHTDDES